MSLSIPNWYVPLVQQATIADYVSLMRKILRTDTSSESDMFSTCRSFLPRPLGSFYLIKEVAAWVEK